jgi:tetratricopeptide (TPR) repeat protein
MPPLLLTLPLALALGQVEPPESPREPAAPAPAPADGAAQNVDFARQRFQRGLELYDARSFETALAEFRASLALYASPNSQLYVARCLRALGRASEAYTEYERTVGLAADRAATDPRYADTRDAARAELGALLQKIGRLKLEAAGLPAGASVRVGGRPIPPTALGLEVPVEPGRVLVTAAAPGHAAFASEVSVPAGGRAILAVRLEPAQAPAPPESARGRRPWMWTAFGVAAAGWLAFGTFYLLADGQHDRLARECGGGPCPASERGAIARGRFYQGVANVSLIVGALGLGTGVLLWALPPSEAGPGARVSLRVSPGTWALSGRF